MSGIYGEGLALQVERIDTDTYPARSNGVSSEIRRLPIRSARVELDGDYAGYWATMRLNPRRRVLDELGSGDTRRACEGLAQIIQAWNVTDEEGRPIEPTGDNVYDLPDDMMGGLLRGYFAQFNAETTVPKGSAAS